MGTWGYHILPSSQIQIFHIMGNNKSTLPEEGKEIMREYETFLDGKKRISTRDFTDRVKKNLQREQKSSSREEEKIRELFSEKSHIEYRDFLYFKLAMGEKLPELLKEVFSEVDDGDGLLTKEELVKLEAGLGNPITLDEAGDIIALWDTDGDGNLTLEEFIEYKEKCQ